MRGTHNQNEDAISSHAQGSSLVQLLKEGKSYVRITKASEHQPSRALSSNKRIVRFYKIEIKKKVALTFLLSRIQWHKTKSDQTNKQTKPTNLKIYKRWNFRK